MTDSGKLLVVEQNAFLDNFPDRHFCIRHHLAGHPLFQPERLLKLAQNLPRHCIEFNAAYAEVSQNPHLTPSTGLGLEETIRNIATSDSWVVLKYVEQDEAYRNLLFQCVRELTPLSETRTPGTHQLEAYIFLSSPGSVTPFHFDDEHNFLLQISGWKNFHAWRIDGAGAATQLDIEAYYQGAHRNLPIRPQAPQADQVFTLKPGDGLHVPVHSPHWVKNGDEVSISFSITFRSKSLAREVVIHRFNGALRRMGLTPKPLGHSPFTDHLKFYLAKTGLSIKSRLSP
ncbi:MAG: cupin domain-containing protein [Porticoccaceae bacterium]|nr:hypothetical protein [Pseudomonadales bacterium]MCP5173081.1 transcription factor [Pseudomonadales bacterium]MCP5302555.1 transcription factor [Pseudomonadales bacterium]